MVLYCGVVLWCCTVVLYCGVVLWCCSYCGVVLWFVGHFHALPALSVAWPHPLRLYVDSTHAPLI